MLSKFCVFLSWEARVAQWWEHLPPTNVTRVADFLLGSIPRATDFSPGIPVFPFQSTKTSYFQIPFLTGMHKHVLIESWKQSRQSNWLSVTYGKEARKKVDRTFFLWREKWWPFHSSSSHLTYNLKLVKYTTGNNVSHLVALGTVETLYLTFSINVTIHFFVGDRITAIFLASPSTVAKICQNDWLASIKNWPFVAIEQWISYNCTWSCSMVIYQKEKTKEYVKFLA